MLDENAEYESLHDEISFDGFDYAEYFEGEQKILKPRLEEKGYSDIVFLMGESDSFGPLSRICECIDKDWKKRIFIYG